VTDETLFTSSLFTIQCVPLGKELAIRQSLALTDKSEIAMVGSNSDDGYPNIKAMLKIRNEGLRRIWFSTNTSSMRVAHFKKDRRACLYFVDMSEFKGLLLVGEMTIHQDMESKRMLWVEGFKKYYPMGVDDPDYCVLCFTSKWGNYYHKLENTSFQIGESANDCAL